jgi:hypothetical protein
MEMLETIVQAECKPGLAVPFTMTPSIEHSNVGPCFHWPFVLEICHQVPLAARRRVSRL